MSAERVTNFYDLMDSAYDAKEIHQFSKQLGHRAIIDPNRRGGDKPPLAPAEKTPLQTNAAPPNASTPCLKTTTAVAACVCAELPKSVCTCCSALLRSAPGNCCASWNERSLITASPKKNSSDLKIAAALSTPNHRAKIKKLAIRPFGIPLKSKFQQHSQFFTEPTAHF